MSHPILNKKRNIITYSIVWILIGVFHSFMLHDVYGLSFVPSIIDGILFNLLFALLGLGIWFPVKFVKFEKRKLISGSINHLGAAAFLLTTWYLIGYNLLTLFFSENHEYIDFLEKSIPFRLLNGGLLYAMLALSYYMMIYYMNLQEKIQNEERLKSLVKETELKALRSQLRPHFLFNSLNSISSLTITSPEKAQDMLIKLSEFFRYSLGKKEDSQLTTFKQELYHITLYLEIEKVRFGKRLVFSKDVHEACLSMKLPGLILQPVIENAIKHGVHYSVENVGLNLKAECDKNYLFLTIGNNYDPEAQSRKGTGTGLANIRERLRIIYGDRDLMVIKNTGNYFEVKFKIPQK